MAMRRERKRSVKQRIRDTKRLLNKEDLPETVRLTKGRVLKCLEQELGEKQRETKERKLAKKYRMVKFFDKRKVSRKLKAKLKELSECEDDKKVAILSCIEQLRKELNYVVHYPPGEKYLALYPSSDSSDERATLKKEHFLQQVADMVESGEAEDASASFLPPTLQCKSSAHVDSSEPASSGGHQLPLAGKKREWPRRKANSEEELKEVCDVLDSKRKLLQGDDFFIQDCVT